VCVGAFSEVATNSDTRIRLDGWRDHLASQRRVDLGVTGPVRAARPASGDGDVPRPGSGVRVGLRWWLLQAGAVACDSALDSFGQVVPQNVTCPRLAWPTVHPRPRLPHSSRRGHGR
jgi:hypothetical protein